jgi:prepilin-type N-terminal cleavage/methylation domain-containing protein
MRRSLNTQRGYTLAEILVVVAVSAIVLIMCYQLIEDAMRTSLFVESHNRLAEFAQRPVNFMQAEVYQNRTVFQGDTVGTAYLARFLVPPAYPTGAWPNCTGASGCGSGVAGWTPPALPAIQNNSLLPILDASNVMGPDAGTGASRMTGNCLLIVRQLPPLLIDYDHDNDVSTPKIKFPADRYRFELYYLSRKTTRPFSTVGYYLDLLQARSIDFADYFQLNTLIGAGGTLSGQAKTDIINGLNAGGLHLSWNPMNQPVANSFYSMDAATGAFTLRANQGIWVYSAKTLLPELGSGSVSGKMLYTVGFRPSATAQLPIRDAIPKYAIFDTTMPEFPSGFEVKIVGSGAARKVLLRLVLVANYGVTRMDSQEGFVISSS